MIFALNLTLNFSSNVHTFLFSELSLKGHLLIKDTNYTITFSMSAIRHCASVEAMFLIVFATRCIGLSCHFSFSQQIIECAAVKFELEKKELLASSGVGRFFVYTHSSTAKHYLGLKVLE